MNWISFRFDLFAIELEGFTFVFEIERLFEIWLVLCTYHGGNKSFGFSVYRDGVSHLKLKI